MSAYPEYLMHESLIAIFRHSTNGILMKANHTFSDGNTRSILDNLNTAVFRTNLEGSSSIIDVNPAFIEMFGYKDKKEIQSVPIIEFYSDPAARSEMQNELFSKGKIRNREITFKRKDGSCFPGRVSSVLVKDDLGKSLFIDGIVDDMSEVKTKEEELLAERQVFFSGPVVLIQWPLSEDEALINISENVFDLLGYEASTFLDGKILYPDLVHEEDKTDLQAHIHSILAGGSDTILVHPYRLRKKGGEYIWVQDYAYVQRDPNGKATGILGYIYDVTALQISQRESLEKEQRLRDLVENSPTGILRIDVKGNIIEVNQKMVDMLGSPSKAATQKFNMFSFQPIIDAGIAAKFHEAINANKVVSYTGQYDSNWGKHVHFKLIISPVLNAEAKVIGAQANMEDVTSTFAAEAYKLKLQNDQLEERRIFMAGPIMIIKWAYSADDPVLAVSENVEKILGYTVEEFMSGSMVPSRIIHPDDIDAVRKTSQEAVSSGVIAFECAPYRLQKKDGNYIWVSDYSTVNRDAQGNPVDFSGIIYDISHVIEAEEELKLLLREVHHRAKNNMQVIMSLLNIQADYVKNEQLSEILGETQNRIRSMALIHDKLFRSKRMSEVDFGNYINSMIIELTNFYKFDPERIRVHQNIEDLRLDISKAIPCGLIVNELVTNAIKYAFPDNREGDVWLSAMHSSDTEAKIQIKDNGIGLGEDLVFEEAKSFGLRIVRILTEQLGGSMKISQKGGTSFTLSFDLTDNI
jgi:PAS domain S-box-containing protein